MASILDICNMALRHVGVSTQIADLDSERTKEAKACRLFYPQVRDEVLRDRPWPFATRVVLLAVVEEEPTTEWLFAYRYPAECVTLRRILTDSMLRVSMFNADEVRYPSLVSRINFRIARDDDGLIIYSQQEAPYAEYTEHVTETETYPPDFVQVLALKLAGYIAPSIAGNDPLKLGDRAFALYERAVARASQNAGNEAEQTDFVNSSSSELEDARG